jgi:threonine/homoserine/homoserine lactone efflux protein
MIASLALLLTPGPAVLYIIARSIDQGRKAGLVSVASIEIGNFVHVVAATLGLSALVLSSATTFMVIKYLGAAYLIYLGLRKLFTHEKPQQDLLASKQNPNQIFTQGIIVAVFNPKTALFFLAFLPQFVNTAHGSVTIQMFILGTIFVSMAVVTDSLYALLAGTARLWLKESPIVARGDRYFAGGMYLILGIAAALANSTRN